MVPSIVQQDRSCWKNAARYTDAARARPRSAGYDLPCRYVIHTVGPIYQDGRHGEEELLRSCYKNALKVAAENHCASVAFPLISAGVYGYPKEEALQVAKDTINEFLKDHAMTVYIVLYEPSSH